MPSKRTKTSDRTSKILNTSVCFGKGICTTKLFSFIIKDIVTRNGSLGRREIAKMVNSVLASAAHILKLERYRED